MALWRKNYVRLKNFQKLRLWWILIPWALKKIAVRKVTSGPILVPVPKQGLWWYLSLYTQLLDCILHTVMLSLLRALSFPGGNQKKCPAQAFSWWPKPEELLIRAFTGHLMPPPNMPGKIGKQRSLSWAILLPRTLICAEPKARTPKSELQRVSSPAVLLPAWAVVPGAALSRGYGDHKAHQGIWSYDNGTLQRWRASHSTVPHRGHLHTGTLTLTLINFILQLTAQAGKSNSFIQLTIKQRSKPGNKGTRFTWHQLNLKIKKRCV